MTYGLQTFNETGELIFDSTNMPVQRLMATINTDDYPSDQVSIPNFDSTAGYYFWYPNTGNPPPYTTGAVYPILSWNNSTKIMSWYWPTALHTYWWLGQAMFTNATWPQPVTIFCIQSLGDPTSSSYGFMAQNPDGKIIIDDSSRTLAVVTKYQNVAFAPFTFLTQVSPGYATYFPSATNDHTNANFPGRYSNTFIGSQAVCAVRPKNGSMLLGVTSRATEGNPPALLGMPTHYSNAESYHDQFILAPHGTKPCTTNNEYGMVIYDSNGNVTFEAGVGYLEVVSVHSFDLQERDVHYHVPSDVTHHHTAIDESLYDIAYIYLSTCPMLCFVNVNGGWTPWDGGRKAAVLFPGLVSSTNSSFTIGWRSRYELPFPRGSTAYRKSTVSGHVRATVIVCKIRKSVNAAPVLLEAREQSDNYEDRTAVSNENLESLLTVGPNVVESGQNNPTAVHDSDGPRGMVIIEGFNGHGLSKIGMDFMSESAIDLHLNSVTVSTLQGDEVIEINRDIKSSKPGRIFQFTYGGPGRLYDGNETPLSLWNEWITPSQLSAVNVVDVLNPNEYHDIRGNITDVYANDATLINDDPDFELEVDFVLTKRNANNVSSFSSTLTYDDLIANGKWYQDGDDPNKWILEAYIMNNGMIYYGGQDFPFESLIFTCILTRHPGSSISGNKETYSLTVETWNLDYDEFWGFMGWDDLSSLLQTATPRWRFRKQTLLRPKSFHISEVKLGS